MRNSEDGLPTSIRNGVSGSRSSPGNLQLVMRGQVEPPYIVSEIFLDRLQSLDGYGRQIRVGRSTCGSTCQLYNGHAVVCVDVAGSSSREIKQPGC